MQLEQDMMTSSLDFSTTIPSAYDSPDLGWVKDICLGLIDFICSFLTHLDPSHFQNVFLGAFALIIPFTLAHLNATNNPQIGDFRKLVMLDYYDSTKHIFWVVLSGLIVFALFDGHGVGWKFVAVVIFIFYCWWIYTPLAKLMTVFNINYHQAEHDFLTKLTYSEGGDTTGVSEKMRRSWESIWSEANIVEEQKFTEIFISHVNNSFAFHEYDTVKSLVISYDMWKTNLHKLDSLVKLYPALLNWHKFSHAPRGLRKVMHNCLISVIKKTKYYDSYIGYEMSTHIAECLQLSDLNEEERDIHIFQLLEIYFLAYINSKVEDDFGMINLSIPDAWKVTLDRSDSIVQRAVVRAFSYWFKRNMKNQSSRDQTSLLSEVINEFFPEVYPNLFFAFMVLTHSQSRSYSLDDIPIVMLVNRLDIAEQIKKANTAKFILEYFKEITYDSGSTITILDHNNLSQIKSDIQKIEVKDDEHNAQDKKRVQELMVEIFDLLIAEISSPTD